MVNDRYTLRASWGDRRVSLEEGAATFRAFVNALPEIDPIYGSWLEGPSAKEVYCPVPLIEEQARALVDSSISRNDLGGRQPQFGYSLGAGHAGSFPHDFREQAYAETIVTFGAHAEIRALVNHVQMRISAQRMRSGQPWRASELRPLMKLVRDIWSPDNICIDCAGYKDFVPTISDRTMSGGRRLLMPRIGWLTYLPAQIASKVPFPPDVAVEALGDGSVIVSLCEEPFSIDNPTHMARARAMEAAIRPMQS